MKGLICSLNPRWPKEVHIFCFAVMEISGNVASGKDKLKLEKIDSGKIWLDCIELQYKM